MSHCTAFDTVDHQLLLRRLECQFSLCGIAVGWFQSYLSCRSYHVIYAGSTSSVIFIVCSVPQGSVLGPLLFIIYVADLVGQHGVTSIPSRMKRSCTCTVTTRTPPQQPLSWQTALSISADEWPPTDWDSTRTRPSSFGLGRDTACPNSRAWVQLCNWAQTLSQRATRSGCTGSPSLPI